MYTEKVAILARHNYHIILLTCNKDITLYQIIISTDYSHLHATYSTTLLFKLYI